MRIAANLYMSIDLASKGSDIDELQIASVLLLFLSSYMILVGSLASFRISFAMPRLCFIKFAPGGGRFRLLFMRQLAILRPMNIVCLFLILSTTIVFSIVGGNWQTFAIRAFVIVSSTVVGLAVVIAIAAWSFRSRSEIQILEMLFLVVLVALNPDIGSFENRISLFFGRIHYPFYRIWELAAVVCLIAILAVLILVAVRVFSAVGRLFRRRLSWRPMESWYWRFVRLKAWVFLYLVVLPAFISSFTTSSTKRWALALSIVFGVASYLYFLSQCENTLNEKWRCSVISNIGIVARSAVVHILLMAIPVLVYIVVVLPR
jgi:hypothetical protein